MLSLIQRRLQNLRQNLFRNVLHGFRIDNVVFKLLRKLVRVAGRRLLRVERIVKFVGVQGFARVPELFRKVLFYLPIIVEHSGLFTLDVGHIHGFPYELPKGLKLLCFIYNFCFENGID